MAEASKKLGRPNAAEEVALLALDLARAQALRQRSSRTTSGGRSA